MTRRIRRVGRKKQGEFVMTRRTKKSARGNERESRDEITQTRIENKETINPVMAKRIPHPSLRKHDIWSEGELGRHSFFPSCFGRENGGGRAVENLRIDKREEGHK